MKGLEYSHWISSQQEDAKTHWRPWIQESNIKHWPCNVSHLSWVVLTTFGILPFEHCILSLHLYIGLFQQHNWRRLSRFICQKLSAWLKLSRVENCSFSSNTCITNNLYIITSRYCLNRDICSRTQFYRTVQLFHFFWPEELLQCIVTTESTTTSPRDQKKCQSQCFH